MNLNRSTGPGFLIVLVVATLFLAGGCSSVRTPTTATTRLDSPLLQKVQQGVVEPGYTPEMVFLALGKPSEPAESLVDATNTGTWVYRDFKPGRPDFLRAGFQSRLTFDSTRKSDVIVTLPMDRATLESLPENSLRVVFHEGRVVNIQRARTP